MGRRAPQGPLRHPPRAPVTQALAEGRPALLEIDLQGARQVRERMPEALFVFLAPPSWEELVRRLVGRGTEGAAERERRLETARDRARRRAGVRRHRGQPPRFTLPARNW